MKVYIMANSPNDFRGRIKIEGEGLLERTVRLLNEHYITPIISGKRKCCGAEHRDCKATGFEEHLYELASLGEKCLILYDDVYYTEACIVNMLTVGISPFASFCCRTANKYTGKQYGEGYGIKIEDTDYFCDMMAQFLLEVKKGNIDKSNKWTWVRYADGKRYDQLYEHIEGEPSQFDILWMDETDDFDYFDDLLTFRTKTGIDVL